jgi:hypothetical protein
MALGNLVMRLETRHKPQLREGWVWPIGREAIEAHFKSVAFDRPLALRYELATKHINWRKVRELGGLELASLSIHPQLEKIFPLVYDPGASILPATLQIFAVPVEHRAAAQTLLELSVLPALAQWFVQQVPEILAQHRESYAKYAWVDSAFSRAEVA